CVNSGYGGSKGSHGCSMETRNLVMYFLFLDFVHSLNFKQENPLPCKKFFQQIFLCVQLRSIFLFIHCTLLFCRTGEVQGHVQGISWSMKEILKESDYKQHLKVQLVLCYFRN
uniref:Uncharacterized protein n=1 Tax=Aegilops tauschii subsp. strangulata TaxID=200361 RepID=A0A453J513_AEGTS